MYQALEFGRQDLFSESCSASVQDAAPNALDMVATVS